MPGPQQDPPFVTAQRSLGVVEYSDRSPGGMHMVGCSVHAAAAAAAVGMKTLEGCAGNWGHWEVASCVELGET